MNPSATRRKSPRRGREAPIKNLLASAKRYRDLLLFVVGINTALRISDLLTLRIGDSIDKQGNSRDHFSIREENAPVTPTRTRSTQDEEHPGSGFAAV